MSNRKVMPKAPGIFKTPRRFGSLSHGLRSKCSDPAESLQKYPLEKFRNIFIRAETEIFNIGIII